MSVIRLAALLVVAFRLPAAIALVAHSTGAGPASTSAAIDSTGATLLVVVVGDGGSSNNPTIVDSKTNTWTRLTLANSGSGSQSVIFYSYSKSGAALAVGASHTVTVTSSFPAFSFSAWSGTRTYPTNPFDVQNTNKTLSAASTIQPGSVTPTGAGSLIVTGVGAQTDLGPDTINSGFATLDLKPFASGTNYSMGSAYLIQGSAAAINPTWTLGTSLTAAATIAVFKQAATAGTNASAFIF